MSKATECYASCNDHKCVRAGRCMGLCGARESEQQLNNEVAMLRGALYDEQHGITATLRNDEIEALREENQRLRAELAAQREQKPVAWMNTKHGNALFLTHWSVYESPAYQSGELTALIVAPRQNPDEPVQTPF